MRSKDYRLFIDDIIRDVVTSKVPQLLATLQIDTNG